jgi:hypothetical protein
MVQKLLAATAWVSIAVLAYATLTHVEFAYSTYYRLSPFLMRPDMRGYAHFEHVVAFAVFGAIFASAYPQRTIFVCCVVFSSAIILEFLQTLTPDRHGTSIDASKRWSEERLEFLLPARSFIFGIENARRKLNPDPSRGLRIS